MSKDVLQIGEFAKQADTNLRTLRYYEELGLIRPTQRTAGKFRHYAPDQVKRVLAIKRLQSLGLSLHEIQEIMVPSSPGATTTFDRIRSGLELQIGLVTERVASLQAELDELNGARRKLDDCLECPHDIGSDACNTCAATSPTAVAVLRSMA
jgi:DNA-binding transcriptional MerR regulator